MKAYVLDKDTRIGDRVIMKMDLESRGWGPKDLTPDGTEGVVVGYHRYHRYYGRDHGIFGFKSGLYEGNGATIVRWDNGKVERISTHHVCPIDQSVLDIRRTDDAYREAFETKMFLKDLPKTEYYEGDIIAVDHFVLNTTIAVKVISIDYDRHNTFCNDGVTAYPIYTVSPINEDGGTTYISAIKVHHVIKRGNHWNYENNIPLEFDSMEDKLSFYHDIGETVEVKNPANGFYRWTIEEARQAIKDKQIAYIRTRSRAVFGNKYVSAYSIPNYP